jgi:hypothetical protein
LFIELSAILDAQLFPNFLRPNSWAPFSWLLRPTIYRTLWTIKVNLLVRKLGAVGLNYLYIQEIEPCSIWQGTSHKQKKDERKEKSKETAITVKK